MHNSRYLGRQSRFLIFNCGWYCFYAQRLHLVASLYRLHFQLLQLFDSFSKLVNIFVLSAKSSEVGVFWWLHSYARILNLQSFKSSTILQSKIDLFLSFLACPNADYCRFHVFDMEGSLASVFPQPLARKAWGRFPAVSMREIYSALAAWYPSGFSVWVVSHSTDPLPR